MTTATEAVLPLSRPRGAPDTRCGRGSATVFRRTTAQEARRGRAATELWDALAEKGYLGINLPGRRRRARDDRTRGGGRGDRNGRQVPPPDHRLARDRGQHPCAPRHRGSERALAAGIAAGTTKIAFAITDPTRARTRTTWRLRSSAAATLPTERPEDLHLGGRARRRCARVARSRPPDGLLGLALARDRRRGTAGFTRDEIPMPYIGPTSSGPSSSTT